MVGRGAGYGVCLTGWVELYVDAGDVSLPATLDVPPNGPARAGVVVLHGSDSPRRSSLLYEHLAHELPQAGVAVLRFDRRPRVHSDVPFAVQADDALAAVAARSAVSRWVCGVGARAPGRRPRWLPADLS